MRDWSVLDAEEKLEVLRLLYVGQTAVGINNLAILAENGLASVDDIEALVEVILRTFENSKVRDAADIDNFRHRLEGLMVEARQVLEGE